VRCIFVVMPNRTDRFSPRLVALAFLFPLVGCSRAKPPAPTSATPAASSSGPVAQAPSQQAIDASTAPLPAERPAAKPPTEGSPAAKPAAAKPPTEGPPAVTSATPTRPAPHVSVSPWTKPQDCSVYDTSPDYRGLSAQDRAHGRLTCETKEEFRAFVATRQACKAASDCGIVSGSCPFDCYVPIAKASEREVRAKLDALAARLDKAGNRCMYGCVGPPEVECVDGRCNAGHR
jgi:hypothetical protein